MICWCLYRFPESAAERLARHAAETSVKSSIRDYHLPLAEVFHIVWTGYTCGASAIFFPVLSLISLVAIIVSAIRADSSTLQLFATLIAPLLAPIIAALQALIIGGIVALGLHLLRRLEARRATSRTG